VWLSQINKNKVSSYYMTVVYYYKIESSGVPWSADPLVVADPANHCWLLLIKADPYTETATNHITHESLQGDRIVPVAQYACASGLISFKNNLFSIDHIIVNNRIPHSLFLMSFHFASFIHREYTSHIAALGEAL